jgi:ATP-dependent helicase/nuclease subunit A
MAWTNEQNLAIYESGKNIIVSAGAGSGKTAVLSERVLQKIISGVHANELLILTFTKAAAEEMKDRIRRKISSNPDLKEELSNLDSAYITTFDSFALSVLKKYHYILNIPQDISITNESIVLIEEENIINEVFENKYRLNDEKFISFIKRYCVKNDKSIRSMVLSIAKSINNNINKEEFIEYIKNEYFSDECINNFIVEYKMLLKVKINGFKLLLDDADY